MIHWMRGVVTKLITLRGGVQTVLVRLPDGSNGKAIHYTDEWRRLAQGDEVLLNTTACDLDLGSGGYHFVAAILSDFTDWDTGADRSQGHMMKLRYTPMQRSVLSVEEQSSPHHDIFRSDNDLEGMLVLIGELHSMLPIVVSRLQQSAGNHKLRIVYVMTDGGALPAAYSKHIDSLKKQGWIQSVITYGHAYGGDMEALNKFTALIAAKHILRADAVIVTMGPGIAGTGTRLGHTGVETGEIINAAAALGGRPIIIPRLSFADRRIRHQGISHHTLTSLRYIALKRAVVPLPSLTDPQRDRILHQLSKSGIDRMHDIEWHTGTDVQSVAEAISALEEPVTTMGRSFADDPVFFLGAAAAADGAFSRLNRTIIS